LNFFSRLPTALRFALSGKTAYELMPTWEQGKPAYPALRFPDNAAAYRKNELIFACVSLKADSASQPSLRVYDQSDEEIPDHPLRLLIQRPNPFLTEFDFFALTLIFLDLAGRSYWEKVRSRAGQVVQLWPLRPDWMAPIKQGGKFIAGYQYKVPGLSQPVALDANDVLDFKLHDPLDFYAGLAPASVASRVGAVDSHATDFLKLFFENGGMPLGLLTTKQKLVDTQVADIRRRWKERYGGFNKWLEPAVLDSDATYQRMGLDFKEMGFGDLDARSEARICMVLRVPPILVGAKVGLDRSTFANYGEARRAFWEDTLAPQFKRIRNECQNDLASEFDGDVELRWDLSEVPAFQEDRTARWGRATTALQAGAITVNMFMDEIGEEDIGPAGEVFLRSFNQVEVPAKRVRPTSVDGKAGKAAAPDDDDRRRSERALDKALNGYFEAQLGRVRRQAPKAVPAGDNGHG
jgi:HK97 family phage portal protein